MKLRLRHFEIRSSASYFYFYNFIFLLKKIQANLIFIKISIVHHVNETKFLKKNKLNFITMVDGYLIWEKKVALACFGIRVTLHVVPFEQKTNVLSDYLKQIWALV